MTYAIVQSTLDVPDIERLKRAFRAVPTLTDLDAHILANDAFGILVKRKSLEHARVLLQALRNEGIEAEMVPDQSLPVMPPTKFVRKIACSPEALILHDPLGRPFPLPWEHIMMIAAGNVRMQQFNSVRSVKYSPSVDGHEVEMREVEYSTREQTTVQFLLELIISRAALRYTVTVDKPMLHQFLGKDFNPNLEASFGMLVRQLACYAPNAAVNRGAYYLKAGAGEVFFYPSQNAFHEEIIWLLWRAAQRGRS